MKDFMNIKRNVNDQPITLFIIFVSIMVNHD